MKGDFDGDGKTDLLLHANDTTSWRSWVARSNGIGSFGERTYWELAGHFGGWHAGVADIDGNGCADLYIQANDADSWRIWFGLAHVPQKVSNEKEWVRYQNLGQNYPNPFHESTTIDYQLENTVKVTSST